MCFIALRGFTRQHIELEAHKWTGLDLSVTITITALST